MFAGGCSANIPHRCDRQEAENRGLALLVLVFQPVLVLLKPRSRASEGRTPLCSARGTKGKVPSLGERMKMNLAEV